MTVVEEETESTTKMEGGADGGASTTSSSNPTTTTSPPEFQKDNSTTFEKAKGGAKPQPTQPSIITGGGSNQNQQKQREPFFQFIPDVTNWGCGIITKEISIAQKAVIGFPKWSTRFLGETFSYYKTNPRILFDEIISGFTVAIMQVPESIAFSFVAGVPPLSGLQATFWMALITGIFGGKPGMISGAAGALAVVVAELTSDNGPLDYLTPEQRLNVLYMTMFVCGIAQIVMAWFRLAKVVRLIPETGLIGFMNGLAIIIFMAQLPAFQYCDAQPLFIECTLDQRQWLNFKDHTATLCLSLVHVFTCMAIMKFFPMVPKIGKIIPASLMGLLVGTFFEHVVFRPLGVSTRTVEETAPIKGTLPKFDWPDITNFDTTDEQSQNTIWIVVSYAITLAIIGGVESVLTLQACNEITDTVPKISDSNQELFAQGLANLVCGLFQAMGGDAMIGQSTINIMNGARHRVSSSMSGIFMLLFIVALSGFINLLPVSTLTGVLFMVVLSTFQWKTFVILRYGRLSDSAAILLVTLIAVFFNLAVGIGVGIVFSALVHAWDSGSHVDADIEYKTGIVINGEEVPGEVKYVHVKGAIFFSSTRKFVNMFHVGSDPDVVILDFSDALIIDHSAVAAIQGICHRFEQAGKLVLLTNVQTKSHGRLHRTGDQKALLSKITHHSEIVETSSSTKSGTGGGGAAADDHEESEESEHAGDVENPEAANTTATAAGATTTTTTTTAGQEPPHHHHINPDFAEVRHQLGELSMFQAPIDSIDNEVEVLLEHQGDVKISEKKNA